MTAYIDALAHIYTTLGYTLARKSVSYLEVYDNGSLLGYVMTFKDELRYSNELLQSIGDCFLSGLDNII